MRAHLVIKLLDALHLLRVCRRAERVLLRVRVVLTDSLASLLLLIRLIDKVPAS